MAAEKPNYPDRIVQDPDILVGKPTVRGTRIPVELVLAKLAHNPDLNELFADYPRLTLEDVKACLEYARALVEKKDRVRLAEEVRSSNEPRVLRRDDEDLAPLSPLSVAPRRRVARRKTKADYEAFLASAGSWKAEDTDALIARIYESRDRSIRSPIEL